VLGDEHRGASVLAPEREALHDANHEQGNRRGDTNRRVRGQDADQGGRAAHQDQRDQERVLAPDQIANSSEEQRAKRPHHEPDGER
jgi:hypothetical protein